VPGPEDSGAGEADGGSPAQCRMEDVVRRTGLTPRAIRYYEEMGLFSPLGRTAGGFRLFTEAGIARLLRIKELQTLLGFSLAEIKDTLHVDAVRAELRQAYAKAPDIEKRREVIDQGIELVQSQMRIIDERTARLAKLREELQERLARLHTFREQPPDDPGMARAGERAGMREQR